MLVTALIAAEKSAVYQPSVSSDAPGVTGRHVRLFRNGANQAVRIPREFEFDAQEVVMKKVGNTLVLEPVTVWPQRGSAAALRMALDEIKKLGPCDDTFPDVDEAVLPLDDIDLTA
jgi:antitoxin VapB